MIPQAYINEWRAFAPWMNEAQIEQDLILSRALIEIFSEPVLAKSLAFRGGTALHKLFIQPPARYSEDIDLVQINEGPIGPLVQKLRDKLNPWLGNPKWKQNEGRVTLTYRFDSENHPITPMRLKVEINTREHFSVLGLIQKPYKIKSLWLTQQTTITTFHLEELLGTKLRALYQRKKGRDLFDLSTALKQFPKLETDKLIHCFKHYMNFQNKKISRAEFEENLHNKMNDTAFVKDIFPLLSPTQRTNYNAKKEIEDVNKNIIYNLAGEGWKGNFK